MTRTESPVLTIGNFTFFFLPPFIFIIDVLLIAYSTLIYVNDSSPQQVSFYLVEVATLGMRKLTKLCC